MNCTDKSTNNTAVIDFGTYGSGGFGLRANCNHDSGVVSYGLRIGSDENPRPISNVPRGEEHVITLTYDGESSQDEHHNNCYLDGVKVNEIYYGGDLPQNVPTIVMFCRYLEQNDFWECFPGTIRDVLLYNRVLSDTEIAEIAAHR